MITRKCFCGRPTTKGLYCTRCDSVNFCVMVIDDYQLDPVKRVMTLDSIESHRITHPAIMVKVGNDKGIPGFIGLGKTLLNRMHKHDYEAQMAIFGKAIREARSKADAEVLARHRATKDAEAAHAEGMAMISEAMSGEFDDLDFGL
jgi:hypothetical protein